MQRILGNQWSAELPRLLKSNVWLENAELVAFLKDPFMRLCARYLYTEKHRGAALNSVGMYLTYSVMSQKVTYILSLKTNLLNILGVL